jgi:hypothetical protein
MNQGEQQKQGNILREKSLLSEDYHDTKQAQAPAG